MAKTFIKDTVVDEVLTEAARYDIKENGGTAYKSDMQIVLTTPVAVAGTDINAALLNKLEIGVDTLDDALVTYTTGGTSTAFTLTTPQASALATLEHWRVKFNATAGATPTLNRDNKGAKSLKQYDSTGAKIACSATTIISGMITDVVYDGVDYVVMDALPSGGAKAAGTDIDTGTDDVKYVTAKALNDSHNIVDVAPGTSGNIPTSNGTDWTSIANDGWVPVAWANPTRTGNQTFTVDVDVSGVVGQSTKLKYTDTTTKYQQILSAVWNSGTGKTTITTYATTDYVFAGNPSAIYFSNAEGPFGFPQWQNFTSTPGGFSGASNIISSKFNIIGKKCTNVITYTLGAGGACSGSVTFTSSTPCAASFPIVTCWLQDYGTNTFAGLAALSVSTITIYAINTAGTYMSVTALSSTIPYTWAVNDFVSILITFDIA
jgi:hypothetical protein